MRCGGLWLDFAATGKVLSSMHGGALELADQAARAAQAAVDTSATGLACPVCFQHLSRMHAGGTTVEVDRCDEHGTWFDRNELREAAEQVAGRRSAAAPGAAASVAAAGDGEYSLLNDPRFSGCFGDDDEDYDEGDGIGESVALAGAFVLFDVLLSFLDS
jgi:Zn-finger nucleic acid-binding protein